MLKSHFLVNPLETIRTYSHPAIRPHPERPHLGRECADEVVCEGQEVDVQDDPPQWSVRVARPKSRRPRELVVADEQVVRVPEMYHRLTFINTRLPMLLELIDHHNLVVILATDDLHKIHEISMVF